MPRLGLKSPRWWFSTLAFVGGLELFDQFHIAAHIFGFTAFEARNGHWPEFLIWGAAYILVKAIYQYVFRRGQTALENQHFREDIIRGRLKRPPLVFRFAVLMAMFVFVMLGLADFLLGGKPGLPLLAGTIPLFLLFAFVELQILLTPGDSVLPDPRDELLAFFQAKTLKAGYVTAIVSLAILTALTPFIPRIIGLLLPICLFASLLVPALIYRRADRKAEVSD